MEEKIYTIPVTEAFENKCCCPFCKLRRDLETAELELIMGASMMEPDIRIKTNELGFCKKHYDRMFEMGNRLSLALMLESHLNEQKNGISIVKKSLFGKSYSEKAAENMKKLSSSCYVCSRVDEKYEKMLLTAVILWEKQSDFKKLFSEQSYFCVPHAAALLELARLRLNKKVFPLFSEALDKIQSTYIESLCDDVSWFCKKFDYRYDAEPWGNAKDAVERAIKFLNGNF